MVNPSSSSAAKRIDAFISYSRSDVFVARRLQSRLQSFAKPWYALRRANVFRDESHLVGTQLGPALEAALDQARYLIVLASPDAARSDWVGTEVARWFVLGERPVLIIVLQGEIGWSDMDGDFDWEVTTCLPTVLRGRLKVEPRWLDLRVTRGARDAEFESKLEAVVADAACEIIGLPKEQLVGEDVRQHRRLALLSRLALAVVTGLFCIASVLGFLAYLKYVESERRLSSAFEMALESLITIEDLRTVPAAGDVRAKLSTHLEVMLKELAPDLPETDRRLVSRRARVAVFDGENELGSGNLVNAQAKFEAAEKIYREPAKRNEIWALAGLGDVYERAARLATMRGDTAEMIRNQALAVQCAEKVYEHEPNDINRGQLATSQDNLGAALGQAGDLEGAQRNHGLALSTVEELFAKDPVLTRRDDLVRSYVMLSELAQRQGQREVELEWLRKAQAKLPDAKVPESERMAPIAVEIAIRMSMHPSTPAEDRSELCARGLAEADRLVNADRRELPSLVLRARLLGPCAIFAGVSGDISRAQQLLAQGSTDLECTLRQEPEYEEAKAVLGWLQSLKMD